MMRPTCVRVAAAQYPLDAVPTFAAWQAKIADWVSRGAATGAQLLVFPEYGALELAATQGAAVTGDLAATLRAAADLSVQAEAHLGALATRHRVHILGPSGPAHHDGGFVNRAAFLSPSGGIGHQAKAIMTPFEKAWGVSPGAGLCVFDTALGRIGVAICYDCEFPLLVRAMTEAGAEIILIPSCTEHLSGYHRVRAGAIARALESQIATVTSPTVGNAAWCAAVDRNSGAAGMFLPPEASLSMTGVLAEGALDTPGWIMAEIDLVAIRRVREAGEMRNSADWDLQPGAARLAQAVCVVTLD